MPATTAPRILILSDVDGSFESTRLAGLLAERVDGTAPIAFRGANAAAAFRPVLTSVRGDGVDVLHAFGGTALGVALLAGRGTPTLYTAARRPSRRDVAFVRAALRYRPLTVVCDSDAERRDWVTGGLPPERCVLVRPGVSLARTPGERNVARERFGFAADDRVLLAPLPRSGAARATALWTGSLLHVLDPKTRLLAWNPPGAPSMGTLLSKLLNPPAVRVAEDVTPAAAFVAADAVLLPPGDTASPTLVAMAMAAGLPVVATATPQYCELLEDRHTALLTPGHTPKDLAARTLDLFADAAQAARLADRCRAEAYDLLLLSRMVRDYDNVYRKAAERRPTSAAVTPPASSVVGHDGLKGVTP